MTVATEKCFYSHFLNIFDIKPVKTVLFFFLKRIDIKGT